jgi:hypothetical protein
MDFDRRHACALDEQFAGKALLQKVIEHAKSENGKQIILPTNIHFYPSIENLDWHRKECFVL